MFVHLVSGVYECRTKALPATSSEYNGHCLERKKQTNIFVFVFKEQNLTSTTCKSNKFKEYLMCSQKLHM